MDKIGILNTAVFSFNKGDYIIMESVKKQLGDILKNNFFVEIPTHSPAFCTYQVMNIFKKKSLLKKNLDSMKYKFVCGTNLLSKSMLKRTPLWNINIFQSKYLKNCVFLGVGCGTYGKINWYTKKILKNVLSKDYIHSVRDEEAKKMLEEIGFKAINTGCPTLWGLTKEHCEQIPISKKDEVVFTLTDYKQDFVNDQKLINILNKNYKRVYFWVQGFYDYEYFKQFKNIENIEIIFSDINEYDNFLEKHDCDYVGTRLHAGIKAIQYKKRSIIIIVDNRARSMKRDYNLNCIERENIDKLEEYINSEIETNINLNLNNIEMWKKQFDNYR
jgi:polysaccharide pyruvyl transferase WcaK-like protein